ncbi:hypothetical protein ACN38_g3561, partial [Penicillium nordicum]
MQGFIYPANHLSIA